MTLQWPKAGINDVGTFLISGIPFVLNGTASATTKVAFPTVTNYVSVKNTASGGSLQLFVGFTQNGVEDNPTGINRRFILEEGELRELPFRIKELWVSGAGVAFDVVAGLSHVMPSQMPEITGSVSGTSDLVPPIFQGVG